MRFCSLKVQNVVLKIDLTGSLFARVYGIQCYVCKVDPVTVLNS